MFWGDRYGQLRDPFGHQWSIAKQVRKMTPEEIAEAAKAAFAAQSNATIRRGAASAGAPADGPAP